MYFPDIISEYQEVSSEDQGNAWTEAIRETFEKFGVSCPLHVYESGFYRGDASDEEIAACIQALGAQDEDALYGKLDGFLEYEYRRRLEETTKILILPEPPVDPERAELEDCEAGCTCNPTTGPWPCPRCADIEEGF